MSSQQQIQGNTIKLRREFVDFSGAAYDPTAIALRLYTTEKVQIGTAIAVGAEHRVAPGAYEVEVTLPMAHNMIVYEFVGTDPRGKPDVQRRAIPTPWVTA